MTFVQALGLVLIVTGGLFEALALWEDWRKIKQLKNLLSFDQTIDIEIAGIVLIIFGLILATLLI